MCCGDGRQPAGGRAADRGYGDDGPAADIAASRDDIDDDIDRHGTDDDISNERHDDHADDNDRCGRLDE